jgi:5-hydroxyisourate hydrolase
MPAKISTHVLDTSLGQPAAGVRVDLTFAGHIVASAVTNADGRTDAPLLSGDDVKPGVYRLDFYVGPYFMAVENPDANRFLEVIPIIFIVDDASRSYHVPLLVSPWSYSTYRGS